MWKPGINEAIINIFQQSSAVVAEWRARILQAVGNNGSLVTGLFPVLVRLIGTQPPVPELPPTEASQRMVSTLTSFLVKFCVGPKRPLIIFFDDIQWADKNSMSLMESFAMHPDCQYVSIIVAYRSEDVDDQHPFTASISRIREAAIRIHDFDCPELKLTELLAFVQDALHTSAEKAWPIAEYLQSKTRGNVLFARQLLLQMQQDSQLVYRLFSPNSLTRGLGSLENNAATAYEVTGECRLASPASLAWSSRAVDDHSNVAANITDSIQLIQRIVGKLSPRIQRLLSLAAYLGSSFNFDSRLGRRARPANCYGIDELCGLRGSG